MAGNQSALRKMTERAEAAEAALAQMTQERDEAVQAKETPFIEDAAVFAVLVQRDGARAALAALQAQLRALLRYVVVSDTPCDYATPDGPYVRWSDLAALLDPPASQEK